MSTKSTIAYSKDKWHLYKDLLEGYPDNIVLQVTRRDSDGTDISVRVKIPWEAAEKLSEYVTKRLAHEANLRDPEWLKAKLAEAQTQLQSTESDFMKVVLEGQIENLQERLKNL